MPAQAESGRAVLILAIATDGEEIASDFASCPSYTLAVIYRGRLAARRVISNPACDPLDRPSKLAVYGLDFVVAGTMDGEARQEFARLGVHSVVGLGGSVDRVLGNWLDEKPDPPVENSDEGLGCDAVGGETANTREGRRP